MNNIIYAGLSLLFVFCFSACSSNEEVDNFAVESRTDLSDSENSTSSFMLSLGESLESLMDIPIVADQAETRGVNQPLEFKKTECVYVDFTLTAQPVDLSRIETPRQILELVRTTGAGLSLVKDEAHSDSLVLSERKCWEAISPTILDSKKYLYGKGFTEDEIQAMLKENNTDESSLVPFVLSLAEEEEQQQNSLVENVESLTRGVDWKLAGKCAVHALGFDALAGLAQSSAKTWSKAALKRVFKTVASKMLGPIGAAVALIDFSLCYWG